MSTINTEFREVFAAGEEWDRFRAHKASIISEIFYSFFKRSKAKRKDLSF
jgi:hypothetical protein